MQLKLRSACGACVLLAAVISVEASAHHPAAEQGRDHVRAQAYGGLEAQTAAFSFFGTAGTYLTVAGLGSYLMTDRLALGGRLPVHKLWLKGQGASSGLGDLDLNLKYQWLGDPALANSPGAMQVSMGIGTALPTGDSHHGLGSGHAEVSPFVSAMLPAGAWMVHGTFSALFSVLGDHHHADEAGEESIDWLSPHADRELQYHVGAMHAIFGDAYGNLVLSGFTSLSHDEEFSGTGLYLSPTLGMSPGNWRINLGPQIPVGGSRRFDWKAGISVGYVL